MPPAHSTGGASAQSPLALSLRSRRQLHGSTSLGQAQLAALAGIPVRYLRALESTRTLPITLRPWLALATALNCSLDDLVARQHVAAAPVVVVLARNRASVALCIAAERIIEVRRRGTRRGSDDIAFRTGVELAVDYGATVLLSDAVDNVSVPPKIQLERVRVGDVARALSLADGRPSTIAAWALGAMPELQRFTKGTTSSGKLSRFDRRGQLVLVAAAMARAWNGDAASMTFYQPELPFQD